MSQRELLFQSEFSSGFQSISSRFSQTSAVDVCVAAAAWRIAVGKGAMEFEPGEHRAAEESQTLSCDITMPQDLPKSNKE